MTAGGVTMVLTMLPGWAHVVRDAGGSTSAPRVLFAESDANDTATVTANATGSTRNDTVCLKLDQLTAPTTDGSNLLSFVVIAGASGGGLSNAPSDGNLYLPLANVAVANGATNIAQGNVTDLRQSTLALGAGLSLPSYLFSTGTIPTVGSGGAGVSALAMVAGSTMLSGGITATLTGIAGGATVGVVAFAGAPLPFAPRFVICSIGNSVSAATPPVFTACNCTTSGFTIKCTNAASTGTYVINYWVCF